MSPDASPASAPVLDFMGRAIVAGNTVVYPSRQGSSMWMNKLKVTQVVGGTGPTIKGVNNFGRLITLRNVANVVVVEPVAGQ